MATLRYRCPVGAEDCPESTQRGYCTVHPHYALEAVREQVVRPPQSEPAPATVTRPHVSLRILGHRVPVPADDPLPIGRDAPAFVNLPGMAEYLQISRCHAELYWVGTHLYIRDTQSMNGTFVDGQRVTTPRRLEPGQALRLAEDVPVQVESLDLDEHGLPR